MIRIDTKRARDSLQPRREPYFYKLSKGRYLGFRKLPDQSATWIARIRDEEGEQHYKSLGELSEAFSFDQAKEAAESWFGTSSAESPGATTTEPRQQCGPPVSTTCWP
jgi:hypothetical protein